jgi:hypothetical protein
MQREGAACATNDENAPQQISASSDLFIRPLFMSKLSKATCAKFTLGQEMHENYCAKALIYRWFIKDLP